MLSSGQLQKATAPSSSASSSSTSRKVQFSSAPFSSPLVTTTTTTTTAATTTAQSPPSMQSQASPQPLSPLSPQEKAWSSLMRSRSMMASSSSMSGSPVRRPSILRSPLLSTTSTTSLQEQLRLVKDQLAEREKEIESREYDLQLAAEIGQNLLQQLEDLSGQNQELLQKRLEMEKQLIEKQQRTSPSQLVRGIPVLEGLGASPRRLPTDTPTRKIRGKRFSMMDDLNCNDDVLGDEQQDGQEMMDSDEKLYSDIKHLRSNLQQVQEEKQVMDERMWELELQVQQLSEEAKAMRAKLEKSRVSAQELAKENKRLTEQLTDWEVRQTAAAPEPSWRTRRAEEDASMVDSWTSPKTPEQNLEALAADRNASPKVTVDAPGEFFRAQMIMLQAALEVEQKEKFELKEHLENAQNVIDQLRSPIAESPVHPWKAGVDPMEGRLSSSKQQKQQQKQQNTPRAALTKSQSLNVGSIPSFKKESDGMEVKGTLFTPLKKVDESPSNQSLLSLKDCASLKDAKEGSSLKEASLKDGSCTSSPSKGSIRSLTSIRRVADVRSSSPARDKSFQMPLLRKVSDLMRQSSLDQEDAPSFQLPPVRKLSSNAARPPASSATDSPFVLPTLRNMPSRSPAMDASHLVVSAPKTIDVGQNVTSPGIGPRRLSTSESQIPVLKSGGSSRVSSVGSVTQVPSLKSPYLISADSRIPIPAPLVAAMKKGPIKNSEHSREVLDAPRAPISTIRMNEVMDEEALMSAMRSGNDVKELAVTSLVVSDLRQLTLASTGVQVQPDVTHQSISTLHQVKALDVAIQVQPSVTHQSTETMSQPDGVDRSMEDRTLQSSFEVSDQSQGPKEIHSRGSMTSPSIPSLTHAILGMWMIKTNANGSGKQRYVWLNPWMRQILWAKRRPSSHGSVSVKSVIISEFRHYPSLNLLEIIPTGNAAVYFRFRNSEDGRIWTESLEYLVKRRALPTLFC